MCIAKEFIVVFLNRDNWGGGVLYRAGKGGGGGGQMSYISMICKGGKPWPRRGKFPPNKQIYTTSITWMQRKPTVTQFATKLWLESMRVMKITTLCSQKTSSKNSILRDIGIFSSIRSNTNKQIIGIHHSWFAITVNCLKMKFSPSHIHITHRFSTFGPFKAIWTQHHIAPYTFPTKAESNLMTKKDGFKAV